MHVTRREFLRAAAGMAGMLGLQTTGLLKLEEALAGSGDPSVIWLQGQSCTGCSISFLNSIYYASVDDILLNKINLEYHPNVMATAGDFAISAAQVARPSTGELLDMQAEWLQKGQNLNLDLNGDGIVNFVDYALLSKRGYILIIEGSIPTGANGGYCEIGGGMSMVDALRIFSKHASQIIAVGTCASYGGMYGAKPNPTGALGVTAALNYIGQPKPVINIPGCPMHPDWLVGTIIDLLTGTAVTLDSNGRPTKFYPAQVIHEHCPLRGTEEANILGQSGCLIELGCKGPRAHADCHIRKWNCPAAGKTGVNWCIGAGSPCIGCTEPTFPDGMTPFYRSGGDGGDD